MLSNGKVNAKKKACADVFFQSESEVILPPPPQQKKHGNELTDAKCVTW